jgi:hypothetical protein
LVTPLGGEATPGQGAAAPPPAPAVTPPPAAATPAAAVAEQPPRPPAPRPAVEKFGTAVGFVGDPVRAAKFAEEDGKLLFVLHLSGHFEDDGFT